MFVPESQKNGGCIQTVSPPRPNKSRRMFWPTSTSLARVPFKA